MSALHSFFEKYAPYLEEIRRRLYRTTLVGVAVFVAGFFSTAFLFRIFLQHFHIENVGFVATSPFQLVDLAMDTGLFLALLAVLPLGTYEVYAFLRSGLTRRERLLFIKLLPLAALLFLTGFAYGFAVLYYALGVVARLNASLGVVNLWDINGFVSQIVLTSVLLGAVFQFPIALTFLIRIGVVPVGFLIAKRRFALAAIFIFTALLPPTDGLSFMVMALPLIAMYEGTILANAKKKI